MTLGTYFSVTYQGSRFSVRVAELVTQAWKHVCRVASIFAVTFSKVQNALLPNLRALDGGKKRASQITIAQGD